MIKSTNMLKTKFVLKASFDTKTLDTNIIKKQNKITEYVSKKEAFIYLGKIDKFDKDTMIATATQIVNNNEREYQIDVNSFKTKKVSEDTIIWALVERYNFINGKIWNVKTKNKKKDKNLDLLNLTINGKKTFEKAMLMSEAVNYTRNFQIMAPNELNSETYANMLKKDFDKISNVSVDVLDKKQITKLNMGLLLSVNLGSAFEPRVVVLEYKGDPSSKEKTALIGKGVTFDSGGYNIKTSHMANMKFDMSGSAIIAGAMQAISKIKPKSNVTAVLVLTDNMVNSIASTPDAVFTAMNGKTVEINNTDAEGRLAMADGLTYAAKKLNATRLVDVATLTGAVLAALGHTYTGVWSTTDKAWEDVSKAAKVANELVWRMPLHKDYIKFMKGSKVADLKNTDLSGMAGSSSAAMFLKSFTEDKEYIHFDVAGTADVNGSPMGALVKTLVEMANG